MRRVIVNSFSLLTLMMAFILLPAQTLVAQDMETAEIVTQDDVEAPRKVAVVIQDSSGMRWNATYFADEDVTAEAALEFIAGDSADCDELDCYLEAAREAEAELFLLINTYGDQVALYDPVTGDLLGEASLSNPFAVFAAALGGEFLPEAADTTAPFSAEMTTLDSVSAAMDSLAAEAMAAAEAAVLAAESEAEALPVSEPYAWNNFDKVLYRHLRNFDAFVENPSQLALEQETATAWSVVLPMPFVPLHVRLNNSAFTPGWVDEWFQGQYLTEADKAEMTSILNGKSLDIQTLVDIPTIFGMRIGPVGINSGAHIAVRGILPGDLLMLPWSNFTSDNPLTDLELSFETLNYSQTNIGYGHNIPTPIGDVRAGAGLGLFFGFGYAKVESEAFTLATSLDSVEVNLAARGFFTDPNIGLINDPNFDNMDLGHFPSTLGIGVNLGAGLNLYPLLKQHVDVQVALSNLGAKLTWENVTEKTFTASAVVYDVVEVMDNSSDSTYIDSLLNPQETVIGVGSHSVTIPAQFSLVAQYQPIRQVLLQVSYRQSLSDGVAWTTDPRLGLYVGLFPVPAVEFRGGINSFMGQTTWSGGFGLHFKRYEMGIDGTAINGMGANASGMGIRLSQSLYF